MPKTKYPIFKCLHRGEKGFTLIELLIVIAILGILAAVVVPNLGKFMGKTGTAQTAAAKTEWDNVQTAMFAMMYDKGLSSVTVTTEEDSMSAFPSDYPLYPDYITPSTTRYGKYSCTSSGTVTQTLK